MSASRRAGRRAAFRLQAHGEHRHVGQRLVGAGALVTEGKEFPDNSLIVGSPARAIKTLEGKAAQSVSLASAWYVKRWNQYAKGLKRVG